MLTTAQGFKKPDAGSGDQRLDLYSAVRDNADKADTLIKYAQALRNANQSIPTGATPTAVTFDTVDFDGGPLIDLAGHPTRVALGLGIWIVTAHVILPSVTDLQIRLSGTTVVTRRKVATAASGGEEAVTGIVFGGISTYVELLAAHGAGGAQNLTGSLGVARVG